MQNDRDLPPLKASATDAQHSRTFWIVAALVAMFVVAMAVFLFYDPARPPT